MPVSRPRCWRRPAAALSRMLRPLLALAIAVVVVIVRGQPEPQPPLEPQPGPDGSSPVGVNYGVGYAKRPLPKSEAFSLLASKGVRRIKLFDRDGAALQAIQAAIPDAQVTVGIGNDELPALAADPAAAVEALQPLREFGPMIRYVAVGSEPNEAKAWEANATALAAVLLPAFENVAAALRSLDGLGNARAVVPLTMAVVDGFAKPPHVRKRRRQKQESGIPIPAVAQGQFLPAWDGPLLRPLLQALNASGAPMMMNIHPYGVYKDHARAVDVGFATGTSSASSSDSGGYGSLLDQLHDTLVTAMAKAGYQEMGIVIGETGWPSGGGVGASAADACRYMQSTLARTAREGTPLRPGNGVELYLFEAFDEDGKTVFGGIEPHWGVLRENGQSKYPIDWVRGAGVECG